ncbi:MAG: LPS assembly lipoprotein LptE [Dokdonella sp.]
MSAIRLIILTALLAALCACGFQLRKEAVLPPGMGTVFVQGADSFSPLGRDLAAALERAGSTVVEKAGNGVAIMNITANKLATDVLSVGGNARANEYSMRYHVEFNVTDNTGKAILGKQVIELSREYTFDAAQARAVAAEEDLLSQELQREMVQSIMRRLDALGRTGKG